MADDESTDLEITEAASVDIAEELPPETPPEAPPADLPPVAPPAIPPVGAASHKPKGRSVLMDILDRAKTETENETERLMASIREREDEARRQREEDEARKAAEARARVEAEKRKLEDSLRQYENRKQKKEEEARAKAAPVVPVMVQAPPPPSHTGRWVAIAGVAIAAVAAGAFFLIPRGEPVVFGLDKAVETARPGAMQLTAMPVGAKTLVWDGPALSPEKVVAMAAPAKYEVAPPQPAVKRNGAAPKKEEPLIKIETGLFGGGKKKVIK